MWRYYQAIFLAFYVLINEEKKQPKNFGQIAKALKGLGDRLRVSEGGKWNASERSNAVDQVRGLIDKGFKKRQKVDPGLNEWLTEFENLLTQSKTENALYDFKQGLFKLDGKHTEEPNIISEIVRTLTAIANHGPEQVGYVIIGVSDKETTADRAKSLYKVESRLVNGFHIHGIDHEARHVKGGLDRYFQSIVDRIKMQPVDPSVGNQIVRDVQLISYYGHSLVLLKVASGSEPTHYDNAFFERHGPNNQEVKGPGIVSLFKRFQ